MMLRFPFLIGAVALSLAGCQTTKGPTETTIQAAMAKMPEQCPLRAELPTPVYSVDHSNAPVNGPGAFDFAVMSGANGSAFMIRCSCGDAFDMSKIDAIRAQNMRRMVVDMDGWTLDDLKFFDDGPTKRSDDISYRDDYTGSRVRKAISYYGGHCVQSVEGMGLKTDLARIDAFMKSIRDVRKPQKPSTVTAPTSGTGRTPADRLRHLQALRDQGLITPAEYEQKRAAIVGAL